MDDMNEKYQKHYGQLLSGTLTETFLKNISFQANIKLANEIISEQDETIKVLSEENEKLKESVVLLETDLNNIQSKQSEYQNENQKLLNNSQFELNKINVELENAKVQLNHMESFRNELQKVREEKESLKRSYESDIINLKDKIEYLQLTPSKRKKVDESKTKELKDGGTF